MANVTVSTNMQLTIPSVGQDSGPDYATQINNSLTTVDSHDHSPGHGVQIQPAGLNITSSLPINQNLLTLVGGISFYPKSQSSSGVLYVNSADLFFNDVNGNQVQITKNGGVNGTPGSITNLVSPATASYVGTSQSFVFQSNVNTPAYLDSASLYLRNLTANSKYLELSPPATIGSNYQLFLPMLPTANNSFVTVNTDGTMNSNVTIDGTSIVNNSNVLSVNGNAISNSDREHAWQLNGHFGSLSYPQDNIDLPFIAPYNLTITSVWIYVGITGTSGTTEFDLRLLNGSSSTSILSTTGKINYNAPDNSYTDSGTIIAADSRITKPVLSTASLTAGQAIFWRLVQAAPGAIDSAIRIWYKQS